MKDKWRKAVFSIISQTKVGKIDWKPEESHKRLKGGGIVPEVESFVGTSKDRSYLFMRKPGWNQALRMSPASKDQYSLSIKTPHGALNCPDGHYGLDELYRVIEKRSKWIDEELDAIIGESGASL